jgi:hypothetical protein
MEIIHIETPQLKTITLSEDALAERQAILDGGQKFQECESAEKQGQIIRYARTAKALIKDVEAFRKRMKKPFQEAGKLIDAKVKEYCGPLEAEVARTAALATEFQKLEDARVEEERIKQAEEQRKALLAAQEAERKAKEAEAKVSQESAGLSEAEQAVVAEMEAEKKKDEYAQSLRQAQPEAARATGQITRTVTVIDSIDKERLYATHPDCVELVPKRSVIKEYLDAGVKLEGVESHTEKRTSIRA